MIACTAAHRTAVAAAGVLLVTLLASPRPVAGTAFRQSAPAERCESFHVLGVRLGMSSGAVRTRFGTLGTPAVSDGHGATLLFEIDETRVEVEFDRRPRRRRAAHVIAVRARRDGQTADTESLLAAFGRELGPADPLDDGGRDEASGLVRRRWSSAPCSARLEVAVEEQVEWWQPLERSVVIRLEAAPPRASAAGEADVE